MKCNFYIGQKVVCVNNKGNFSSIARASLGSDGCVEIKEGEIYTIRDIYYDPFCKDDGIVVNLEEVRRKIHEGGRELGYHHSRFRPLEKKKTDISIFQSILNDVKAEEKEPA